MMKTPTGIGGWIASSYEAKVPFLQQVPRECADFLLLNAQIREYEAGEIIIQGGVEGQSFCVMQSGRAEVCGQILPDGHYSVLAYIESGACFAEMSILCNELTSNTIIAAEDGCTVLDPFLGSGSSAVAAKKLGRHFVGIEREERYCAWAEKRLALAEEDPRIQGYEDGVFWERNTAAMMKKARNAK